MQRAISNPIQSFFHDFPPFIQLLKKYSGGVDSHTSTIKHFTRINLGTANGRAQNSQVFKYSLPTPQVCRQRIL